MPGSQLHRLMSFIRAFGPTLGFFLWWSLLFQSQILLRNIFRVSVPGIAHTLQLRRQDLPIFWQIMVMREYDLQSFAQTRRLLARYAAILTEGKNPVIIDCGGHVGFSAVWLATQFPGATVHVIEPDFCNFEVLQLNTAPYLNIVALRGGIWGHPCRLTISNPDAGSASFQVREVSECSGLPRSNLLRGYSVDEICGMVVQPKLFGVKIDIEGAERELFMRQSEWLQHSDLVIIEIHDWLLPWQGTSRNFLSDSPSRNLTSF